MTTSIIANLEKMLGGPHDNALLHYSLGNAWLKVGNTAKAICYLHEAIDLDARHSATWKLLGKALSESGMPEAALEAYTKGIAVAEDKGDLQAAKEMSVFVKRLRKQLAGTGT